MSSVSQEIRKTLKDFVGLRRNLLREIRKEEHTLAQLRRDEERLNALTGRVPRTSGPGRRAQPTRSSNGKRLDWSAVLSKLPSTFTAADVKKASGKNKPSEIFAAVTRWIKAGTALKKERGVYAKTSAASVAASTRKASRSTQRKGQPVSALRPTATKRKKAAAPKKAAVKRAKPAKRKASDSSLSNGRDTSEASATA